MPTEHHVHFTEQAPNEFSAELRMIVNIAQLAGAEAGIPGIEADDLAFPFGLQHIPVGLELIGLGELRVVGDRETGDAAFIDEDVLALGVDIPMLVFPP